MFVSACDIRENKRQEVDEAIKQVGVGVGVGVYSPSTKPGPVGFSQRSRD
jgi:hypothetical protein